MKGAVIVVLVIDFLTLLLYILNVTYVLQNLVFTHDTFTSSNVPFYSASLGENTTKWYRYHWWEYASDSLRIIPTFLTLMALVVGVAFKVKWMGGYIGFTAILLAMEFLKLFKRGVDYVRCGSFQLCRNFDVSSQASASSANSIFIMGVFLTLAFVVVYAILIGVFGYIESSLEAYIEKINEFKSRKEEKDDLEEERIRIESVNRKNRKRDVSPPLQTSRKIKSESRGRSRSKSKSKR
jgi:hypothetical protein